MNYAKSPILTPEQAADVVNYYYVGANNEARTKGWDDKLSIGQAAIQTTLNRHSILPEGGPMLTYEEMGAGLSHIESLQSAKVVDIQSPPCLPQPAADRLTPEQEVAADRLVDAGVANYQVARQRAAGF